MTWPDDFASVTGVGFGGVLALAAIRQVPRGVRWLFEFFGGRMDRRAAALDADTRFIIENLRAELKRMAERQEQSDQRIGATEHEIRELRSELADCQKKHAESEAKAARLEALIGLTGVGMKSAFPVNKAMPNDMAVLAAKLDGGQ